jgi:hypothetical protein
LPANEITSCLDRSLPYLCQCGSVSFSESFDPDDPALMDHYPDYTTETDFGDRPPTPTQQRDENSNFLSGSIAPLFVSMLLVCGELVRRCVVTRFV